MQTTVMFSLDDDETTGKAEVFDLDSGESFITISFGDGISLHLAGTDLVSAHQARVLATALVKAAGQIEQRLKLRLEDQHNGKTASGATGR